MLISLCDVLLIDSDSLVAKLVGFHLLIPSLSTRFCALSLFHSFQVKSCPLLHSVVVYSTNRLLGGSLYFCSFYWTKLAKMLFFLLFTIFVLFRYYITIFHDLI